MSARQKVGSGAPWEAAVGYSRAVRQGPHVWVAGTTGVGPDGTPAAADAYGQARRAFEIVEEALTALGASLGDVVRTRLYVVDAARDAEAVGRAHGEVFGEVRPAATLLQVAALIRPDLVVEVEADAYVAGEGAPLSGRT
ncbi:MAG: RidA family protein [Rubricoccaceae bacterium]|nr:RidA family protein [Rubricoccaceae bacterium]